MSLRDICKHCGKEYPYEAGRPCNLCQACERRGLVDSKPIITGPTNPIVTGEHKRKKKRRLQVVGWRKRS